MKLHQNEGYHDVLPHKYRHQYPIKKLGESINLMMHYLIVRYTLQYIT